METVPHGIGVQNRYALFYDECLDPMEILKQTEEQKSKKKSEKPVKKPAKTAPPAPQKKPAESVATTKAVKIQDQDTVSKPRGKPAVQSKPSNQNDYRENARNKDDNYFSGGDRDREGGSEFRRGRGGFRGSRGGPGGRGRGFFPNSDNRNKRVFDRKSGSDKSGVKPVEKRDGAGSNNWGDIRGDIGQRREEMGWDEEFEGEPPRQEFGGNSGDEQNTEFGKAEEGIKNDSLDNSETKENDQISEEEQQIQDAMKEMTLDEWKKEQEAKRVVPKYNLRKPGEGEDEKQWKKGYVLKKKPKEDDEEEEEDEEDEEYARRGPQKVLLDIQFNYADSRRGNRGRGRGGRGGPRSGPRDNANRDSPREDRLRDGRGGRGGPPKSRGGQQAAPRVDDFNDFPSLVNA